MLLLSVTIERASRCLRAAGSAMTEPPADAPRPKELYIDEQVTAAHASSAVTQLFDAIGTCVGASKRSGKCACVRPILRVVLFKSRHNNPEPLQHCACAVGPLHRPDRAADRVRDASRRRRRAAPRTCAPPMKPAPHQRPAIIVLSSVTLLCQQRGAAHAKVQHDQKLLRASASRYGHDRFTVKYFLTYQKSPSYPLTRVVLRAILDRS